MNRPAPQEERWITAALRTGVATDTPWLQERSGGWKTVSLLTRCAFFILGIIAAVLAAGIFSILGIPGPMLAAGIAAICVAETLIAQRKLFGAGIEEALEMTGVLLIIAQIVAATSINDETSIFVFIAIGLLLVGIRMLNAFFITTAALALSFTVYSMNSGIYEYRAARIAASVFCFIVAACALAAGAKSFQRPSIDRMLDWLVIAMPIAGYGWLLNYNLNGLTWLLLRDNALAAAPLIMIGAFGSTALIVGLQRRRHAPILAALLSVACVAYELRKLTGLTLELRLILWGSVALIITLGLIAYLRKPRDGITSDEVASGTQVLDLVELVGVSSLAPPAVDAKPEYQGAGGDFGGGGASDRY
ncbi:MAG: hypothetical protein QM808_12565 [Steroidobacteraceae bacterium]